VRKVKKLELENKKLTIGRVLKRKITPTQAAKELSCSRQTIYNYLKKSVKDGLGALRDGRHSNFCKITLGQRSEIISRKREKSFRSARKVLELTGIKQITQRRVNQIFVEEGLSHLNIERLKPITRFVAQSPNDLWQADIMGKIFFPCLVNSYTKEIGCWAYLIANIDDCSRFVLGGKWFSKQTQMNVFRVWSHCLFQWGLPKAILQDKGSQYRSTNLKGEATYQDYAKQLGIQLIFAHKAQTKGKIERFWRFLQRDFVRENLDVRFFEELNKRFFEWQIKFNEEFKSEGLGMHKRTPAEVYQPSERTKSKQELQELLTITVRRFVYTDSTISLFGIRYKIPPGYIACRVWLYLRGDKVSLESMGKIIYQFRLKV